MELLDIIARKKRGEALTDAEIACFAASAADPSSRDYQLAAMLMAIRLMGMDERETASLAMAMARTGDMLEPDVGGAPVDKHSTGGVGDTTTLVLVPLVAACGAKVIKMSGRSLGHTGGTLDKLESIPGMRVTLSEDVFLDIVRKVGCCVVGQSLDLAPADRRLYALRDVTSTVDSIPLIASSIMSKKLALGARGIVLDVKTGSGALLDSLEACVELSQLMVEIGARAGRKVTALITGMQEPLGSHVGNALAIKEAVDVLSGRSQGPLLTVSLLLGEQMLLTGGVASNAAEARGMLMKALGSGQGLERFERMVAAQGGDARVCRDTSLLPQASVLRAVLSEETGWLTGVDTRAVGNAARSLGAGRKTSEDRIDPAAGLVMLKRIGDPVLRGEALAMIHANDEGLAQAAGSALSGALRISDRPADRAKLLYAVVTQEGTEVF